MKVRVGSFADKLNKSQPASRGLFYTLNIRPIQRITRRFSRRCIAGRVNRFWLGIFFLARFFRAQLHHFDLLHSFLQQAPANPSQMSTHTKTKITKQITKRCCGKNYYLVNSSHRSTNSDTTQGKRSAPYRIDARRRSSAPRRAARCTRDGRHGIDRGFAPGL